MNYVHDHHEHFDGSGYPRGLRGSEISIGGRILAACDAFDALTSRRAFRDAMDADETIRYLGNEVGRLLDPHVYQALKAVVESGKTHSSVLKEFQQDAVRGLITHVDLQEVRLDQPIHATVPLHLTGESVGAKEGGVLNQVLTELNVEALPMEVPASVDFDVSGLHLGESAHLSQVALPDGVTLLDDGETVFVTVTQPTREVEPEPEEGAEGEEGVEGEADEGEEPTAEGEEPAADSDTESEE